MAARQEERREGDGESAGAGHLPTIIHARRGRPARTLPAVSRRDYSFEMVRGPDLEALLHAALRAREPLERDPDLDAFRLVNGWREGIDGFEIDRLGDAAVIRYRPEVGDRLDVVVAALDRWRRVPILIAEARGSTPVALRGEPRGRIVVREHGLRFEVDPMRPASTGLYLDARPARRWIRDHAADRRVLNLFAFTGSLGVAAAAGGARSVTHVDSHRGALAWCRANSELNGIAIDDRDLARLNIYQHLRRGQASRQRYDAIILDPPPGPSTPRPRDRTPGQRGVAALARLVAPMLAPGAWLLCFFHHGDRDLSSLEAEVCAAAGVPLEVSWRGESGPDFPATDPRRKLRVTALSRPREELRSRT